jgi:simple sugar transport system permease protein
MVVVIQGLVILFSGAMEHVFRPHIIRLYLRIVGRRVAAESAA